MNHLTRLFFKAIKTNRMLACTAFAGSMLMTSCSEEPLKAAYFTLIDDSRGTFVKELTMTPDGGTRTFTLVSNRDWEIQYTPASWFAITPVSGNGVGSITLTIAPNESSNEDSTSLSVINNTLLVVDNFKIKRQTYCTDYKGSLIIASPISDLCTTCTTDTSRIAATTALTYVAGKTVLSLNATVNLSSAFLLNMVFNGDMQTTNVNGKTVFAYHSTGTFDLTPLGVIIGDPSVTGVKNTVVDAYITAGDLAATIVIAPNLDRTPGPASTVITISGKR